MAEINMDDQARDVAQYELRSAACRVKFLNLGGIITAIEVPDRQGAFANVVLAHDNIAEYLANKPYFGAIVGRYANRIAGARFTLDGAEHRLSANDHGNSLHGGVKGFDKAIWTVETDGRRAVLRHTSEDGDQGFPGRLDATAVYSLASENELHVTFEAVTTNPTHVNLSQHGYFNLSGNPERDILDHELMVSASRFTVVDDTLIPTGELRSVIGTPFDFTKPMRIGSRIGARDDQLTLGKGYDHNFVLDDSRGLLRRAAILSDELSGRILDVDTTEPGIQVYSGNHLEGARYRTGIALETQHYPDSPNHPDFPSTVLRPGETYHTETIFRFRTD